MTKAGQIVILNGAPRGGKSSIAAQVQDSFDGVWVNLGVDAWAAVTPARLRPGIGLRPGGERLSWSLTSCSSTPASTRRSRPTAGRD
jgi:chloramphenicol 3-O phosphotransferase